jgi:hypothetical protein
VAIQKVPAGFKYFDHVLSGNSDHLSE